MERDIWKACALKSTPGRRAVLEVLEESRGPVTAEEVYRRILARGGEAGSRTCLSTVYRTLSTLAEKGLLLRSAGPDGWAMLGMNREALADFLGAARPSVSRELSHMQRDGLIECARTGIRLTDRAALEELV